jgi:acetyl-CoA decarbonylase/synthase complex subunit beta
VTLQFGKDALDRQRLVMEKFQRDREEAIRNASEENADEFYLCIDCQPFSQAHTCVITPDRPPVCGRLPNEIKAGAIWGVDYRPWTRRKVGSADLQHVVAKGDAVDAEAGEWSGINAAIRELTDGKISRMRLHSVSEFPPSSCACFGAMAFKLPGIDGIGVMHKRYSGEAPGELNSFILANRASGKQSPGVTGFNPRYFKSRKAFAAEGGLKAIKWATKKLYEQMKPYLPDDARVATEDDATTLEELKAFLEQGAPSGKSGR